MNNAQKARAKYLKTVAREFGVPEETVFMLADLLGPNEDFDGLLVELEDYVAAGYDDYVAAGMMA